MENSLEVIKSLKLTLNSTISALLVKSEVSNCCKKFVHIKMELLSYMNKKL